MMVHCDGFKVSDLNFGGGVGQPVSIWQDLTCYEGGKPICLLHVMGVNGRVNPATVGKTGDSGFSNVYSHVHSVGAWRVEHHVSCDGLSEVYDFVAEGNKAYAAFATIFVPKTGAMPDLVRQEQEAEALAV